MRRYRRALLYAGLALAVPLPALAVGGDKDNGATSATVDLGVSASLDSCGVLDGAVVCKLDATWHPAPGATHYTASVTTPKGTVVDYGEVSEGSASIWVKYAGAGTYRVTISAWGKLPGGRRARVVAEDDAGTPAAGEGEGEPGASVNTADAPDPAQPGVEPAQAEPPVDDAPGSAEEAGNPDPPEEAADCVQPRSGEEVAAPTAADEAAGLTGDAAACPEDEPVPAG